MTHLGALSSSFEMASCARGAPLRAARPTHVADVRLADVEYVGAIGDSISTGFNARNQRPLDMLTSLGNLDDLGVACEANLISSVTL